jgi:WD40 repeat protein/transcriptional regulator with XRE-family HTH domain
MDASQPDEWFRGLLLRHRGRTGLTQRDLATRLGVHTRSVQDWEAGVNYPSAERLQGLLAALLQAGGLTAGLEAQEAETLWAAVERDSVRMHTPFDRLWFAQLLSERDGGQPLPLREAASGASGKGRATTMERRQDWGEAPDVLGFVGRTECLATLRSWVLEEHCRLIAVVGMGGIGKTSLAAKLGLEVTPHFERVYWRSLRDAPPTSDSLAGAIGFLSDQHIAAPPIVSEQLTLLLSLLRDRRCLLVLDNFETLFEPGQREGLYRSDLAGYGYLLQAVAEATHQSCLVLTSREAPPELATLEGGRVRTFHVGGLGVDEAQVLLAPKELVGATHDWARLIERFGGNGLALKIVGESIRELFGGDIDMFLEQSGHATIFGGVRRLLSEQVERSSAPEEDVLRVLAIEREPLRLAELLGVMGPRVGRAAVLEAVEALRRRSLVERADTPGAAAFTLQSVVLEYVTDHLVGDVADEIQRGQPSLMLDHPLIHAQAKDYVRQTQERLIGETILQQLRAHDDERRTEQRLVELLEEWRGLPDKEQGYGPGNVINLLRLLRGDLRGLDLSRLIIRQAYLQRTEAQDASLAGSRLAEVVLGDAFGAVVAVALSADGTRVAAGTLGGDVQAWRVADRAPVLAVRGHIGAVWSVALSSDGRLLASGGDDGTVQLWDTETSRRLTTLEGHRGGIWGVAMDAGGHLVASGGYDCTARLWRLGPGGELDRLPAVLEGHAEAVRWVSLSEDGRLLASGGNDGTLRLWDIESSRLLGILDAHGGVIFGVALSADGRLAASAQSDGVHLWDTEGSRPLAILEGHSGTVYGVALSADGRLVASGGTDATVRLWDAQSGLPLAILEGHAGAVHGVALSGDGQLAASGSDDGSVRLWEVQGGRPLAVLEGRAGAVYGVALSADGRLLASGTDDGGVRLWEIDSGQPLAALEGRGGVLSGVALSADGRLVASGGNDGLVRVWEAASSRPVVALRGHAGVVYGVALSGNGRLVVSGGNDGTVRLWDVVAERQLGRPLAVLEGHSGGVYGVAMSVDGRLVVSGGDDGTVRLWEVAGGQLVAALEGNAGVVYSVALSPDGRLVASGGLDGVVRLRKLPEGQPIAALEGHRGAVWGVAVSADGWLVASGGDDGAVRLWDVVRGCQLAALEGHSGVVRVVTFSADGQLVASGSLDGTVKLWDAVRHTLLRTMRPDRRFERLDITGLTGVTSAQRAALLALGAREHK